jgi:O-antigen/teichoic acid export membrane protein
VAAHVVNWFYDGRYLDGAWQLPLYCLSLSLLMLDSLISSMFKAKGMLSNGYASIFVTGSASILLGFLLIPQHYAMVWVVLSTSAIGLSTALLLHIRTNTSSQRADIMTNAQL